MAQFWIGTSGWHYKDWRGVFYPKDLPVRDWLRYYALSFPTVELNNSFYRQPALATWDSWRHASPGGFRFAVKANRFLTHIKRLKGCARPLRRFLRGTARLGDRLGPVLFQMPPTFHRTEDNVARLEKFLALLPRRPRCVFEFRHDSWFDDETLAQLRCRNVGFCCYDMVGTRTPLVATASFVYMRFHGSQANYGGSYSRSALATWARRLEAVARDVDEVYVYFNNDVHGHAVTNAIMLSRLLRVRPADSRRP